MLPLKATVTEATLAVHYLLYIFNAAVIFFLAGFMSMTQNKIIDSMSARNFLDSAAAVPWSPTQIVIFAVTSFSLFIILSIFYRRCIAKQSSYRHIILIFEIIICLIVMRSINMAYDGIILLVIADLVGGYRGKNQRIILTLAMLGLYLIANYNLIDLRTKMISLDAYILYYEQPVQGLLKAACNIFTSFNMIIFVLYIMLLVQGQHQEKERIKSLNIQLNTANKKLRLYAAKAEHLAETRERNRLAREIHDTLGHALTCIIAGLDACIATLDAAPSFTKKQLPIIRATAQNGINDVRRSVKKLRPDNLEKSSLKDALLKMTDEFSHTSGMNIKLTFDFCPQNLREDETETIYRIVQEGITNANRHGHASTVMILLSGRKNQLHIILRDNGISCKTITQGWGLRHMQERIELLKGTLRCNNLTDGFIINAMIPINKGGN
ncbi:sensor histidine kinase [Pectinatus frisingensis]|uniref:sensor histidine kinase n=1 Tax=Pectinatus frisingensis TaxID=865 RepID=UPI003D8077BB